MGQQDYKKEDLQLRLTGLSSIETGASKEMEAINAANFLMNNDPHGAQWIKTNKIESSQSLSSFSPVSMSHNLQLSGLISSAISKPW